MKGNQTEKIFQNSAGDFPAIPPGPDASALGIKLNQPVSIVDQIERIGDKRNRTAFIIGGIIGAFVPVAVYTLTTHVMGDAGSHVDVVKAWEASLENKMLLILILAGGVFSAKSVYGWGSSAFAGDRLKALGFCVLIEGVMVLSPIGWLRIFAAAFLLVINAVATGANLMVESGPDAGDDLPFVETPIDQKQAHHTAAIEAFPPSLVEVRTLNARAKKAGTKQAVRRRKAARILSQVPSITNLELAKRIGTTERTATLDRRAIELMKIKGTSKANKVQSASK